MNHRERVLAALRREAPDRVPFFYRDVPEVETRLCRDLGLPDREALLRHLDIDFRWVAPSYIGPPLWNPATGRQRLIWGLEQQFVRFSGEAGYWEYVSHPLIDSHDASALDDYPWPRLEWFDFSTLGAQVDACSGYAVMTAPGPASPAIFQTPLQALIGEERSLTDLYLNPGFIHALIDRIMAFVHPFVDRMLAAGGGRIDFMRIGDDFGTQRGLLMGPDQWREFIQPPLRLLAQTARKHGARLYLHSCGAVRELIPDFIATGVDVLDPVQVKAAGMVPAELKAEFGARIGFSGGVDEQELLPRGTPAQVRAGVRELLDAMGPGGGFFIGPTHNFQDDIPTANIVAMYEAAREWRP